MHQVCDTELKCTQTRDLTTGVISAVSGATSGTGVAARPNVAAAQAITGYATINAIWWDVLHSTDHCAATHRRSTLIAEEIISR